MRKLLACLLSPALFAAKVEVAGQEQERKCSCVLTSVLTLDHALHDRFGWKANLDIATHHNDPNPEWSSDDYGVGSGGKRWFCLNASTAALLSSPTSTAGEGGLQLEVWDYNYTDW